MNATTALVTNSFDIGYAQSDELQKARKQHELKRIIDQFLTSLWQGSTSTSASGATLNVPGVAPAKSSIGTILLELGDKWILFADANLSTMLSDLAQMLQESSDSEDILPLKQNIAEATWKLLTEAHHFLRESFPLGTIYPDGDGGLRIDWTRQGRELRLVHRPSQERERYIYREFGDEYAIDYSVSPNTLANWLKWLKGNEE